MDITKLQTCDILVFKNSGPIGWFDHGYGHIAVVSSIINNDVYVIEAHLWTKDMNGKMVSGILERKLRVEEYKDITIRRYIEPIATLDRYLFIEKCRKDLVGKVWYDLFSFPRLWFWGSILKPLGLGNLDTNVHASHGEVCSTWPQEYMVKWLGVDPLPDLEDDAGTPSAYMETKALVTIAC